MNGPWGTKGIKSRKSTREGGRSVQQFPAHDEGEQRHHANGILGETPTAANSEVGERKVLLEGT